MTVFATYAKHVIQTRRKPQLFANINVYNQWHYQQTNKNYSDAPVKYSSSKAAGWKAEFSRRGISKADDSPWFQSLSISLSLTAFLLYFCVIREESDIDHVLNASLYDHIEGLEESELRRALEYNLSLGKDTEAIKRRLREIEMAKQHLSIKEK